MPDGSTRPPRWLRRPPALVVVPLLIVGVLAVAAWLDPSGIAPPRRTVVVAPREEWPVPGGTAMSGDGRTIARLGWGPFEADWRTNPPTFRTHARIDLDDAATGDRRRTISFAPAHDMFTRGPVALSRAGGLVAQADAGRWAGEHPAAPGVVRVWEATTGRLVAELTGCPGGVLDLQFAPDGSTLHVLSRPTPDLARIVRWRTAGWRAEPDRVYAVKPASTLAATPDGSALAEADPDAGTVRLLGGARAHWEARTTPPSARAPLALAIASDGGVLAVVGPDRVEFRDAATGALRATGPGGMGDVAAFSSDGRHLAIAGTRQVSTERWTTQLRRLVEPLPVFPGMTRAIGQVAVLEAASGRAIRRFDLPDDETFAHSIAFAAGDRLIVTEGRGGVRTAMRMNYSVMRQSFREWGGPR